MTDAKHTRRWRRARPHCGGWWLWKERKGEAEMVLVADSGMEVADDDAWECETGQPPRDVWCENYWGGTETTQKMMPGLWMQCAPDTTYDTRMLTAKQAK